MPDGRTSAESSAKPPKTKRFPGAVVVFAAVAVLAVAFLAARQYFGTSPLATSSPTAGASIGGPFTLINQDGRTVTDAEFRGQYLLVYFGFTFCPDVCPTSLARNADALSLLGEKAAKVTPILITVDPERDPPEAMKQYVAQFGQGLIGLTGSPDQIAAAARNYRVYYAKAVPQGAAAEAYVIDHSAFTYLVGPDGRFIQFFRHDASAAELADELKRRIH